ncbi:MAG TPA: cytochrome C, partial [Planctomycetes bacterium]|nr:cytochrome C [Planctomycetota bacterium]
MKRTIPLLARMAPLGLLVLALLAGASPGPPDPSAGADPEKSPYAGKAEKPWASTADHSKFKILQQDFPDGPSVTKACLTCHTEAARQIMKTSHWTWICPKARKEMGVKEIKHQVPYGKAEYIINNFCISLPSNEPRCTSCHAGYGWADKTFDFKNQYLVDCLVCHDQTGKYKKFPTAAGHPVYKKDYPKGREWPP